MRQLIHDINGQIFLVRGNAELIEMTTQDQATREKSLKLIAACDKLADLAQLLQTQVRERNL